MLLILNWTCLQCHNSILEKRMHHNTMFMLIKCLSVTLFLILYLNTMKLWISFIKKRNNILETTVVPLKLLHNFRNGGWLNTHHVPGEVGQPVEDWFDSADKLQMFGFTDSLLNQEENKTGRHKGHGENYTDGNQNVHWGRHPETGRRKKKT